MRDPRRNNGHGSGTLCTIHTKHTQYCIHMRDHRLGWMAGIIPSPPNPTPIRIELQSPLHLDKISGGLQAHQIPHYGRNSQICQVRVYISSSRLQEIFRPPFWSGLKSANPAISSQLKSCLLLAQSTKSAKFGTKTVASVFSLTPDEVKRGVWCILLVRLLFYSIQEYTS